MKNLAERIARARESAADREGDIRLKELISAMIVDADPATGDPTHVSVHTHFRAWTRYFRPEDLEMLRAQNDDELAQIVANWIQGAIDKDMLSLSIPPSIYPGGLAGKGVHGVVRYL